MPLSVNVEKQSIEVLVNEALAPEARSARVADFARRQIRAADESNRRAFGVLPPKTVTVNGRENPELKDLPPDSGTIKVHYQLVQEVLSWIMDTLRERSPVLSGAYRQGHKLVADDTFDVDPNNAPLASNYTFFNVVPYARKIEVGRTKTGRAFVLKVENRIYKRTADDAKAKFGNAVDISSGYLATYTLKRDQAYRTFVGGGMRTSKRQRPDRVAGSSITVPAIYVKPR